MALIKCPECGKEISDKSDNCIHCGFPLTKTKNKICVINGKEYDLSFVLDFYKDHPDEKVKLIGTFRRITNCGLKDAKDVIDKILETNEIPKVLILKQQESSKPKEESNKNQIHCPKCNSTAVTTGARGVSWFWGTIGSSKTVNRCANCGYTWKPNGR